MTFKPVQWSRAGDTLGRGWNNDPIQPYPLISFFSFTNQKVQGNLTKRFLRRTTKFVLDTAPVHWNGTLNWQAKLKDGQRSWQVETVFNQVPRMTMEKISLICLVRKAVLINCPAFDLINFLIKLSAEWEVWIVMITVDRLFTEATAYNSLSGCFSLRHRRN